MYNSIIKKIQYKDLFEPIDSIPTGTIRLIAFGNHATLSLVLDCDGSKKIVYFDPNFSRFYSVDRLTKEVIRQVQQGFFHTYVCRQDFSETEEVMIHELQYVGANLPKITAIESQKINSTSIPSHRGILEKIIAARGIDRLSEDARNIAKGACNGISLHLAKCLIESPLDTLAALENFSIFSDETVLTVARLQLDLGSRCAEQFRYIDAMFSPEEQTNLVRLYHEMLIEKLKSKKWDSGLHLESSGYEGHLSIQAVFGQSSLDGRESSFLQYAIKQNDRLLVKGLLDSIQQYVSGKKASLSAYNLILVSAIFYAKKSHQYDYIELIIDSLCEHGFLPHMQDFSWVGFVLSTAFCADKKISAQFAQKLISSGADISIPYLEAPLLHHVLSMGLPHEFFLENQQMLTKESLNEAEVQVYGVETAFTRFIASIDSFNNTWMDSMDLFLESGMNIFLSERAPQDHYAMLQSKVDKAISQMFYSINEVTDVRLRPLLMKIFTQECPSYALENLFAHAWIWNMPAASVLQEITLTDQMVAKYTDQCNPLMFLMGEFLAGQTRGLSRKRLTLEHIHKTNLIGKFAGRGFIQTELLYAMITNNTIVVDQIIKEQDEQVLADIYDTINRMSILEEHQAASLYLKVMDRTRDTTYVPVPSG
jgi:hypothetical protein